MMRALVLALMTVVATTGTAAGSAALDFRHCDAWKRMSGCDPHGEAIRAARGARRLTDIAALPVTDPGVRLRYEGSIDRGQGNEDWNWGVYRDVRGDWVLMEADGPGCIFNFVQHRFVTDCKAPVFRFYFEGESMPRLEISPAEFGVRSPFFAPLAGAQKWQGKWRFGPTDKMQDFSIGRSFVPMEFTNGVRITSSTRVVRMLSDWQHGKMVAQMIRNLYWENTYVKSVMLNGKPI